MILGGASRSHRFTDENWRALENAMNTIVARDGVRWLLTASRRPIVATRVPGPADVLPSETTTPANNPDAFIALCRRIINEPERFTELMAPVWDFAQRELTVDAMAAQTLAVYRDALGSHTRSAPSP